MAERNGLTEKAKKYLEYLRKRTEDRGVKSDLRRSVQCEELEHRVYSVIAPFCNLTSDTGRLIHLYIGGLYALHPKHDPKMGNFGSSLKNLVSKINNGRITTEDLERFAPRFNDLIVCRELDQLCKKLLQLVRRLDNEGIPVNYETLYCDLSYWGKWGERVRRSWAQSYWSNSPKETPNEEIPDESDED